MNIESIDNIKAQNNILKENINEANVEQFGNQNFGNEAEYTYESLLVELDSLSTDITALTKAPKQFLKILTYPERININECLININNKIQDIDSSDDLVNLSDDLVNKLKQAIRPFHIRYTKKRLLNFDKELSELTRKKIKFSQQLSSLKKQSIASTTSKNKLDEMLALLTEQKQQLADDMTKNQEKLDELNHNIDNCNTNANHIIEIKQQADSQKELIDNFAEKITEREIQLESQAEKTKNFNEKLEEFTKERDRLLEDAEYLIEQAKTAMKLGEASGISSGLQTQYNEIKREKYTGLKSILNVFIGARIWVWGALLFSIIAIGIGIWLGYSEILKINTIFARISLIFISLTGAWFCAGQYVKMSNISTDYAYKVSLAKSIVAFSEQLKNDDKEDTSYQDYIKKILDEIHQHPLKNHKKQESVTPIEKVVEIVLEKLKKNPVNK